MKTTLLKSPLIALVSSSVFHVAVVSSQSLSLYDAIQRALHNNQTVLYGAEQNYLSSRAQLSSTEATYNPMLSASLNLSRAFSKTKLVDSYSSAGTYDTWQSQQLLPSLGLQQTLLTPLGSRLTLGSSLQTALTGLSSLSYQSSPAFTLSYQQPLSASGIASGHAELLRARQNFNQSEMTYRLQKEQLALSVVQSYYQLWQALRSVEQSERDFESAQRVLTVAELRLKSGTIAEFEVLNVRVQYRLSEDNLLQARNNVKTQTVAFLRLLGENIESSADLDPAIPLDSVTFSLAYAIETSLKNRLEVKQAELAVELASLTRDQSASALSPSLRFDASYSFSSLSEPTFFNSLTLPNSGWNMQATISVPILDGGRTSAQVEIAERNVAVQRKNLSLLKEEISIDVENQYRTLELDRHRLASLALSLAAAEEALRIAELRFKSGQISSTEIENVRSRFNAAQNALNGTKISYVIERAQLAKAMGELIPWIESLKRPQ